MKIKSLFLAAALFWVGSCATPEKGPPPLTHAEITQYVPAHVQDRGGWAQDVATAIVALELVPTAERVCAVLAIIAQESNFQTDPTVRNLPEIVREGLRKKLDVLGPLSEPALSLLLKGSAPHQKESFEERIKKLRTEKDLDLFYRDMQATYRGKFPGSFLIASALMRIFGEKGFDEMNPVTTAGSMQVKVAFARTLKDFENLSDSEVRDRLYTRAGGIRAGTARLLGYKASYDNVIFRFADYNSGIYSSRNAEFQRMLGDLVGKDLVLDGDLLNYDSMGVATDAESNSLKAMLAFASKHDLWAWRVRRAARKEKTEVFEDYPIWESVRAEWQKTHKSDLKYARLPQITLQSPKLAKQRTTEWFAASVLKHYERFRKIKPAI